MTGTIPELYNKLSVENVKISLQEFYCLIKIMEQIGQARIIGSRKHKEAGRRPKVYEIPNFDVKFTIFAKE